MTQTTWHADGQLVRSANGNVCYCQTPELALAIVGLAEALEELLAWPGNRESQDMAAKALAAAKGER